MATAVGFGDFGLKSLCQVNKGAGQCFRVKQTCVAGYN